MDWSKLGSKRGVFELREIDELEPGGEGFYYYGEWDRRDNLPSGRGYLYVKGDYLYCGMIKYDGPDENDRAAGGS